MSLKCTKVKQDCGLFYTDDNLDCLPLTPMQGDTNLTYTDERTDKRTDLSTVLPHLSVLSGQIRFQYLCSPCESKSALQV